MRLSELQQGGTRTRGRQTGEQIQSEGNVQLGTIQNVVPYTEPIRALLNNRQPVTITASANIVGMSPAKEFIDEHGKFDWASVEDLTVNDPRYLPQAEAQLERLTRTPK